MKTLALLKTLRLLLACMLVGLGCWIMGLDSGEGDQTDLGSPASEPARQLAPQEEADRPMEKDRKPSMAVMQLAGSERKAGDIRQSRPNPSVASLPSTPTAPKRGVQVYVTIDGPAHRFGTLYVRSREQRCFTIANGVLRPASLAGKQFVPLWDHALPPEAAVLGEDCEALLVLAPEVQHLVDSIVAAHPEARAIVGLLRRRDGVLSFDVKEVDPHARENRQPGMAVTASN